jgi:hypothetical protein
MSKTAVIVSGTLRHLVNASSSWTIPGDYFLIVDKDIYTTANDQVVGSSFDILTENLNNSHVKFKSVFVCIDNGLPAEMRAHSSINMINKWKLAYYNLLPYNIMNNYERVIILRPDIYLFARQPVRKLLEIVPQDNEIYTTQGLSKLSFGEHGDRLVMNDVLLMTTLNTLARLGNELGAYYFEHYRDSVENGYEVHSLMAKFVTERNITVKPDLQNYFEFAILRDNSADLFDQGSISQRVTFMDIKQRSEEWWKDAYEKNQAKYKQEQEQRQQ